MCHYLLGKVLQMNPQTSFLEVQTSFTSNLTIHTTKLYPLLAIKSTQCQFLSPFDSCNHPALLSFGVFQYLILDCSTNFSWRIFSSLIRWIPYFFPTQKLHHQGSNKNNRVKHPTQIQFRLSFSFCTMQLN